MAHQPPRLNNTAGDRYRRLGGFGELGRTEGITKGAPRRQWALWRLEEGWTKADIAYALGVTSGGLHCLLAGRTRHRAKAKRPEATA